MATGDLITTARARIAPALADTDEQLLAALLTQASEVLTGWLKRNVFAASRQEWYDGDDWDGGNNRLLLEEPLYPSGAVTACTIYDLDGTTYVIPPATDLYWDPRTSEVWFQRNPQNSGGYRFWPLGRRNIQITWDTGVCADIASVPAALAGACVELMILLNATNTVDPTVQQERLGDYQVMQKPLFDYMGQLPKNIMANIGRYRNELA